jgi:6-phosphofructokinase 1
MKKGNLLVAHGGGPTAVINASLRGVIEEARTRNDTIDKILGARFGAEGILSDDLFDLSIWSEDEVRRLSDTPASALGSCRRKIGDNDYETVFKCFEKHNIRYFFYNGGNDSMDTCNKISAFADKSGYDINVIGIPKTIDNDLAYTDHSPGYGSAARYAATAAVELAMDASSLPIHVVVKELMGRNAGWIAAAASLFKEEMPCDLLVYLPEVNLSIDKFLTDVKERYNRKRGLLVCVSEGVKNQDGMLYGDTGVRDGFGHVIPGGAAQSLANLILQNTDLKARAEKPGLIGRVSMAHKSIVDHDEAYTAGRFAVRSAALGQSGFMVSIAAERTNGYSSKMELVPLEKVANIEKKFPNEWILPSNNGITEDFHDYCLPLIGATTPRYTTILK